MKIISYNINGVKRFLDDQQLITSFFGGGKPAQDLHQMIATENPDVLFLQEMKLNADFDPKILKRLTKIFPHFFVNANTGPVQRYSGVGFFSKVQPEKIFKDFEFYKEDSGSRTHFEAMPFSKEGRLITCDFSDFFIVNAYVPNSKNGFTRLEERSIWEGCISEYIADLRKIKPVIYCGDFNVAIESSRKNGHFPGCHPQEKKMMADLCHKNSLVDCFRAKNPGVVKWSHTFCGIGTRLDGFLCSAVFVAKVERCDILEWVVGSDHKPTVLEVKIKKF